MAKASKDSGYYRYSDEEKAEHLKAWAASGETQQAYAATSGISAGTLAKWKVAADKAAKQVAKQTSTKVAKGSKSNGAFAKLPMSSTYGQFGNGSNGAGAENGNGNGNGHGGGGAKVLAAGDSAVVSTTLTMEELVAQNIELRGLVKQLGRML